MSEDDPLIGTLVADRYRVGKKLGEGGMGVVYLAVHEALRKQVALKVLGTTRRIDAELMARFEREAIAAANLKHPNIAEATDFGQLPEGGLYLVMEYVEGTTLKRLIADQGKLAPERAIAILQQIGSALATAHARDVVHRDLKPDNVIVSSVPASSKGGASDVVKVIDFGIAKLRSATFGGGGTGLTSAGTVFGTPEYMSPEQVMGQEVDGRADQYALGVLAFELFTGKPPYKADDRGQLMMMHVGAPVPSTREKSPGLNPAIDTVTAKMLAKLPDERFASVDEAMQALAAALTAPMPAAVAPVAPVAPQVTALLPQRPMPAAVSHETTLPSPKHDAVVPSVASSPSVPSVPSSSDRRLPVLAIVAGGAGLLILVLVVVVVALLARSREEPVAPASSPEMEATAQAEAPTAPATTPAVPATTPAAPAAEKPKPPAAAPIATPAAAPAAAPLAAPIADPARTNGNANGKGKGRDKGKK